MKSSPVFLSRESSLIRRLVAVTVFASSAALLHAAPLNLVQDPAGTGSYTALVSDSFSAIGVASADDWSFEGEAGDRVSVRLEAVVGTSRPRVRLLNAANTILFSFDGGTDGVGTMPPFQITTPGTYRVRVYTDHAVSNYTMRVELGRGLDLESEPNDTVATASIPVPKVGAGALNFSVAGLAHGTDTAGDFFDLGLVHAGSVLTANAVLPPSGSLTAANTSLRLFERRTTDRALDLTNLTYATVPHNAVFDAIETANVVTVEAWIYIRSWPQGRFTIIDKYKQSLDWGWIFEIENGGGGISFWNGINTRATADVTPSVNTWHHVAVAYEHAAGASGVRFYLDGVLVATKPSPGVLLNTDTDPAYIGFSPSGGDQYSDGPIGEVRLWNRALTTAEIQANYLATTMTGTEAGLVGLWRFDEGTGLIAADASPSGNNATLGGGDPTKVPGWTSSGPIRPQAPVAGTSITRTLPTDSDVWLQLSASANRGLSARYLLNGSISDTGRLHVVATSFPAEGGSTTAYIQGFSITFDDELDPIAANNLANVELRASGPDATFGTPDDIVYALAPPNYVNGTVINYALLQGPLQPGALKLTVGLGMRDRAGNQLDGTFTRNFTAQSFDGYRIESQNNGTFATATTLAASGAPGAGFGWSWRDGVNFAVGTTPLGVATGDLNNDGKLDLVSANYDAGTISVLLGNGDGTFGTATSYPAPNNPFKVMVGDLNADGRPDVAVTRRSGAAVRVFLNANNGTGALLTGVDYATGAGPHWLTMHDINGDTRLDLVTANYEGNNVSILYNNGNGTFPAATNMAVSGNPHGVAAGDLNGDGRIDVAVGTYGDRAVKVLYRQTDGTYTAGEVFPWGPSYGTESVAIGDINGDGKADLIASQHYNPELRRWHQQLTGVSGANGIISLSVPPNSQDGNGLSGIWSVSAPPFPLSQAGIGALVKPSWVTGDNNDLILHDHQYVNAHIPDPTRAVVTYYFNAPVVVKQLEIIQHINGISRVEGFVGDSLGSMVSIGNVFGPAGDVTNTQIAAEGTSQVFQFTNTTAARYFRFVVTKTSLSNGWASYRAFPRDTAGNRILGATDGGTQTTALIEAAPLNHGGSVYGWAVKLADLNGDGMSDVIQGRDSYVSVFENQGAGTFGLPAYPSTAGQHARDVTVGDFNGDGRPDLAAAAQGSNALRVLLARGPETLPADGTAFLGKGRGNISVNGDLDYFSFSAKVGDRVFVSSETPSHAESTGLIYRVYRPEGDQVASLNASNGSDQAQFIAPVSGIYYVRVEYWYAYSGEYRFMVAVVPGTFQLESEANNSIGQADPVTWTATASAQNATMGGIVNYGDTGDVYALGFLDVGTQVGLGASKPASSGLNWILDILDSAGTSVISAAVNVPNLAYTIPATKAGNYYARIRANSGADMFAQYRLTLALGDTAAPVITADTLPAEGTTVTNFFDSFQLNFSENLQATSVNNTANYDLRSAGPDGSFVTTADDILYTVTLASAYSSGLSASYRVSDGPLQPGLYRLQVKTGLVDLYANPLAAVYTRSFSVAGVAPYVFESRSNGTFATATSLAASGGEGPGFGGSWRDGVNYAVGSTPLGVATGDLNNDGKLDLVSTNYDSGTISVLLGNGDGTFATAVNYPAPNNPFKVMVGDLNGDSRPDVAVTRRNGGAVRVFLNANNGTGGLLTGVDYATGTGPHWLAMRDINGDSHLDLVTANYEGNNVSIFYNNGNGTGTFPAAVNLPVSGNPHGVAAGDLNGDGRVDVAVGTYGSEKAVKVFYRQNDGTYTAGDVFAWGPSYGTESVAIGDINGDGRSDLIASQHYHPELRRWHQQANGTLLEGTPLNHGGHVYGWSARLFDLNGDGMSEVVQGRDSYVAVFENQGAGVFGFPGYPSTAGQHARDVVAADFNGDGRPDLAAAAQGLNALRVFLGRGPETLPPDGTAFLGRARGNISFNGDFDYYSFSAKIGDRVFVSSETPNHAESTGLIYRVYRPEGDQVASLNASNGSDQAQFVAPTSGVYYVRVEYWYQYAGEYRFMVAVVPGTFGLESEANNSVGQADPVGWTASADAQTAVMGGIVNYGDPGDVYALGFLDVGTEVTLGASKPASSGLNWILDILNASGTPVASAAVNVATLSYTIPSGGAGNYYARIRASSGADMFGQYRLSLSLGDTAAPIITADTLPAEGSTVTNFFDSFSLSFSEILQAASVNNIANYELRSAGPDGSFVTTADDILYTVTLASAYSSGLSASYRVSDGPLQPGLYRLQVKTGLVDLYANPLAAVYTRSFSVAGVPPYVFESRSNGSFGTATSLGAAGGEGPGFSGSWRDGVNYATAGSTPLGVAAGDLNGDGKLDLVSANWDSASISVLLGNGDGTFGTATTYPAPANPFKVVMGDLNGDGRPDVAVTRRNGAAVRVFLNANNGTGALLTGIDYATGTGPHWLAMRDLNGDTRLDLVTANYEGNNVSIFYNNGDGTFPAATNIPVTGNPHGVAAGDLNNDGRTDIAVGTYGSEKAVKVLYRQADGTYAPGDVFAWGPSYGTESVAIGDINGDGRPDLIASQHYHPELRRWHQQANGALLEGAPLNHGGHVYGWTVKLHDLDGDGLNEVIQGRDSYVSVFENQGGGVFGLPSYPSNSGQHARDVIVGDFNGDGRPDIVAASQGHNALRVFLGRGPETLPVDGTAFLGRGRGNISVNGDLDYYSFSAKIGDRIIVSSETPNHAESTGLIYRVYRPEGDQVASLNNSNGSDQAQFIAPASGIYYVRVEYWYQYSGEYRFMVAVIPGNVGLESETNNAANQADVVAWTQGAGTQSATLAGIVNYGDPGDWFSLGSLGSGTQITLNASKPPSSGLVWLLDILNSSSVAVATGVAGATPISYTIPGGVSGTYYARIRASSGADLVAQYRLALTLSDTQAPFIAANSLPAEGTQTTDLFDRFTLTFSEDMDAVTVNDLANYALHTAGADGTFDTTDDVTVPLVLTSAYSSGVTVGLRTANGGAFSVGSYRLRVLPGLKDRYGNALSPVHTRLFSVAQIQVAGFVNETEPNNTRATATPMPLVNSQPDLFGAGARGFLFNGNETDYWTFNLQAGDRVYLQGEIPGSPGASGLTYELTNPAGTVLTSFQSEYTGSWSIPLFTVATTGAHVLRVTPWYGYAGEYRFRVYILRGSLQVEVEPNDGISTATPIALASSGNNRSGSITGLSRVAGDLDYFNLGTIQAGTTLFLSTRQPTGSTFTPVVSLYNSSGILLAEAGGGRAGDPVAQVDISVTGTYYALARTSGDTSGINSEYILDVLVVPTVDISFPNLQVTSLTPPPASGLKSGDATTISFRVDNLGNLATAAVNWIDRAVLSTDAIYGNADDIELAVFQRSGPLNANASYTVSAAPITIPDGISGNFRVIVRTDHTNTVSEFVLEGDNETVTDAPIAIGLAEYPDLRIESLALSEPDAGGVRTASWNLANRGTGPAAAGHSQRFLVRNNSLGTTAVNNLIAVASALAPNATLAQQATFTTTTAGQYSVEVTADAQSQRFEYNPSGHSAAETNNVATAGFTIIQFFTITVAADPVAGGTVDGAGTFAEGTNRTVNAVANSPYLFVGWYEGAFLRSTSPSFTSALFSNRNLTARFAYPNFIIATQVNPPGTGIVTGAGVYALGANVSLSAAPSPGYRFDNWTEGATNLGTVTPLTFTASEARTIRANFAEANPTHIVSITTSPPDLGTVTGAGTYANGATATIAAPATITVGDTEHTFVRFHLGGTTISTAPSFNKTFTTLDPPSLSYVAEYRSQPVKPSVAEVISSHASPVPATSNYQVTLRFDRPMNQAVKPVVALASTNATTIPTVSPNGTWIAADRYVVPPITFGSANGGNYTLRVSIAEDVQNRVMNPADVLTFAVDVTPPALPTLIAGAVTPTSAAVDWAGYTAPPDLASFRVYLSPTAFTNLDGLSPVASLAASVRSHAFSGLTLDTDYFAAVVPVDASGNAATSVTPLTVKIASTIPPALAFEVIATATNAARVTWTFSPTGQIGFSGFKVYRSSTPFTSISGLTPVATLPEAARLFNDPGLDRTQTHHYAVVGYNRLGQSLTTVTSKPWTDPLSGTLATDFTANEPLLIISQPLTISGGATFTVPPGTVVAFGPGASLTVQSGRLVADGTIFSPIVFTSLADVENGTRERGAWNGITLADTTRSSTMRNSLVKYGKGLLVLGGTHTIDTLGAVWNDLGGLRVSNGATLTTQAAYLSDNTVGAIIDGGASLTLTNSVLRNNTVNASAAGGGVLTATGNWWGTADGALIAAKLSGPVNAGTPLAGEQILTRGLRSADGTNSTGVANLPMHFASLNATSYRVSEDSNFAGVLFVDVPRNPLSVDLFNSSFWPATIPLSPGGGSKTLYAQFRSPTGMVSPTVSFTTNYVTTGPVITAFSLTEGQTINRPLNVNAVAASALPIASLKFLVDDVVVATSTSSPFNTPWDIRPLTPGVHRTRLEVLDTAGNLAARSLNVVINPNPPPRPVITSPIDGSSSTINQLTVTGTAEPLADIRIYRNGSVVATVAANAAGAFSAPAVQFAEGTNEIKAVAFDAIGTTASTSVFVNVDSGPPVPVTLLPIAYNVGAGIFLDWDLPTSGEVPVIFRVLWHNAPFSSAAEATGQSPTMLRSYAVLNTVPDGMRYFAVVGYDDAGNASALSNVRSFNVDMTPPSFAVAYNQSMPVGPGSLGITVTASEPLGAAPLLLMRPEGGGLLTVTLTPSGGNSYAANFPVTSLSARTGTAGIGITGTDVAGNTFTGPPSGPALVFDMTKPTGVLTTSQPGPIQTSSNVTLSVSLVLSEVPKVGTTPTLSFSPPIGSAVPILLAGSGLNWSGQITVTPAMDNGFGTFLLSVEDQVGNIGTVLTSGEKLELYNTATPTPPQVPQNLAVLPLKGGYIRLTWNAADRAHTYRLYREAGASAAAPTTLVHSDIGGLTFDDLPPADGPYRYVVTAFRLGAESGPSGVRATTSDRTPPPAPTATTATLGVTGINVAWTAGPGEIPAKWLVYRNGVVVTTINNSATNSYVDSPGRGVITYAVAAADTLGNEAQGPTATIELYVGAVANLRATVDSAIGTTLTWASGDPITTGYNVYRNGVKQNAAPLTATTYVDTFAAGGLPIQYSVTARNAAGQESAARTLLVQPVSAVIALNRTAAGDQPSVARYFDNYNLSLTIGAGASVPLAFGNGEIIRAVVGEAPLQATFPLPSSALAGETKVVDVAVPAPNMPGVIQGTAFTFSTAADAGGSSVHYRFIQDFPAGGPSGVMLNLSAQAPPLAGGLNDFTVQVFNRGFAPADLVLTRGGNTLPGDLEIQVIRSDGVLVSTIPFQGSMSGTIVGLSGESFLRVNPGASVTIPFTGVLVPEALGNQPVTFRARFKSIYNAIGTPQQRTAGPLEGSMASSLQVTPYYGSASTAQPSYSDNQPVIITGQALNRTTGQPMPNVPLRIGIRVRGAVIYASVMTDGTGAYQHSYTPSLGLAGELVIWAAHPDVVDQLDQARVTFYRLFTKPGRVEATMSKNDHLDFDIGLLNPGDASLTNPTVSFRAFRLVGGVEVPVTTLTGVARLALPSTLGAQSESKISLRLQAQLDAPDDAQFEFQFGTGQGASTKLGGTVSFRPALAVLTTVSPTVGYAEAGVARGQLKSVDVTVQNRGLRALTGARLVPPAAIPWMQVNLPVDAAGNIPLADIPIGGSRSFTVVFAPPDSTSVGFHNDFLLIKGDNAVGDYRLNLFATVTSEQKGSVRFAVTNTFSNPVPNTSIWLRNPILGTEVGPLLTDVNGQVVAPNLMDGEWQWKTHAAGHGATQGVVTIVPNQTVGVETELSLSMVTVKFSVVPVAFTDYYEIKIEQTFQTRTPIPNLILSPPHQSLQVEAGWSGTLLYTLRNEGLRSIFDVKVTGASLPTMRCTPLVNFLPELQAQETVQIPVFFEYFGPADEAGGTAGADLAVTLREMADGSSTGVKLSSAPLAPSRAAARAVGSGPVSAPPTAAGTVDDIIDCYKNFKYGTITLQAAGGISSVSGQPYTVGVNATIDVDALLGLLCDGDCPDNWTGGGSSIAGKVADWACGKIVGKIVEQVGKKTKVIDIVCKAANIIKALACAAAQLPTSQSVGGGFGPGGGGGFGPGGGGGLGGGWSIGGAGCFAAGTPVTRADGTTQLIENIRQGDLLLAGLSGRTDSVAQVMALQSDHVRQLSFRARGIAEAPVSELRLTHDHRVWVDGRGWVFSVDVKVGDWLHGVDGRFHEVVQNERLPGRHPVYGLQMGRDNVFYAAGVLAEDQCFKEQPTFRANLQTGVAR